MIVPALAALLVAAALVVVGLLPRTPLVVAAVAAAGLVWAFFAWFFRDPERTAGPGVVSPADGRVQTAERDGERWRIAVFMNVTDVHVNRFPLDARVERIDTSGSGFRPAYRADARHNLQRSYALATPEGPVEVVQMTGILARRLVSLVGPGDARRKGERLGLIVLGSRVDTLLPADRFDPVVRAGDRVRAGESTIARPRE